MKHSANALKLLYCVICGEPMPLRKCRPLYCRPACRQKAFRMRRAGVVPGEMRWEAFKKVRQLMSDSGKSVTNMQNSD